MLNVLEECTIMAAGLGSKNIFTSRYGQKLLAYEVKMSWSRGSFSDPITILNAYQMFKDLERREFFKQPGEPTWKQEKRWAVHNFIELKALKVRWNCFFFFRKTYLTLFLFSAS